MAYIRIIAVPEGSTPLAMREPWVNVEIPLATEEEMLSEPPITLRLESTPKGYLVFTHKAVDALIRAKKLEAAAYWSAFVLQAAYIRFEKEVCELID